MNKVEKTAEQIRTLSRVELEEFRTWYAEFEAQAPDTDAAWLKEVEDRLAAHRAGDLAAIDVEQVFGELADTDERPITPEQRAELDRCLDAYEASGRQSRPANDVIAEIKKKL